MDIRVNKESSVPLHQQISGQLVYLIGTVRLKPGARLPSVRAFSQRLGIHRNTIGRAYDDLILNLLVEKRAGRRLMVRAPGPQTAARVREELDDLINALVAEARRRQYPLQQLHDRLRDRLLAAPPDHILVVSDDPGMRLLLPKELSRRFSCRIDACTTVEIVANPDRGVGAVVVSPPGHVARIEPALAGDRPAVPLLYAPADDDLAVIRRLESASLIVVVSVSRYFLHMARVLLAPAVGRRHSLRAHLAAGGWPDRLGAADVVLCDLIWYPVVRARCQSGTVLLHRVMAESCLEEIARNLSAAPSWQLPSDARVQAG